MTKQKFTKFISIMELEMGFIRVPSEYKNLFPDKKSKIKICLNNKERSSLFAYDPKHQRIYGLTDFFQQASEQDILEIEKLGESKFFILLVK